MSTGAIGARAFLFTLFGDYVQPLSPRGAWIGGLISLASEFNVSGIALRSAVSRMTSEDWLLADRRSSRSRYRLTRRGRGLIDAGIRRIYGPEEMGWNGRWLLVSYSLPESRRNQRDRLRSGLSFLGFGSLGNGIFVSPRDLRQEVLSLVRTHGVGREATVHFGEVDWPESPGAIVKRAWDLSLLQRRYAAYEEANRVALTEVRAFQRAGRLEPREAFRRRFALTHQHRHLLFGDPDLPAELLPKRWIGHAAKRIFREYNLVLKPAADRYYLATVGA